MLRTFRNIIFYTKIIFRGNASLHGKLISSKMLVHIKFWYKKISNNKKNLRISEILKIKVAFNDICGHALFYNKKI